MLANLLEPGVEGCRVGHRFDSRRSHFASVQSNAHPCDEASGGSDRLRYWGLLIYGATLSIRTPCGLAFEDKRVEGRAIIRVHILDPAALATSSQALVSF